MDPKQTTPHPDPAPRREPYMTDAELERILTYLRDTGQLDTEWWRQ